MIDFTNKLEISLEKSISAQLLGDRIHSLYVLDARDDTAAMGFYSVSKLEATKYSVHKNAFVKDKDYDQWSRIYHCSPSLEEALGKWMNEYLQCDGTGSVKDNILIVVKKLWLSYQADKPRFDSAYAGAAADGWNAGVLCKLEFYLERDSVFYPLYRVDTLYTHLDLLYDYSGIRFIDHGGMYLTGALENSLVKLLKINPEEIVSTRRKLSYSDIRSEFYKKQSVPVLRAITLNRGVYKSYEEFKNNSPTIMEYEFRSGSIGDILFVKEGDMDYPTRTAWGYCDGNNIFIHSGNKYSKLIRQGNTFYFYGMKELARRSQLRFMKASMLNFATNSGEKKSVYKKELRYYILDMESGEVY